MLFRFAQPWGLAWGVGIMIMVVVMRIFWHRPLLYVYPLVHFIKQYKLQASTWCTKFLFWWRFLMLSLLALLMGKPQLVDVHSKIQVDGIDILLVLDVSGSMIAIDDLNDKRSRLEVAKQEALHFIDQRPNDAIGLVLFGRYALARCPLTLDKSVLKDIVKDLQLGQPSVDMQDGTMLMQGLITAMRRLQSSQAKSKIIILLTDGAPSPGDVVADTALCIAKDLGIKIYTIGVGSDQGGYVHDKVFGYQRALSYAFNSQLLKQVAMVTAGQYFEAKKPQDLKRIYDTIDKLEKRSMQTEIYQNYHDYFMPIVWLLIALILIELCMSTFIWFIV